MAANLAGMALIPYYDYLMELFETNEDLKNTSEGIFKQMAFGAGSTFAGGLVAGPPGALVGGIMGLVYGYCKSDNYASMISILQKLSDKDKAKLAAKIQELVGSSSLEALTSFISSKDQRELLINTIRSS